MAKTVKIPLVMKNGEKVTDMKSLKENFDTESVIGFFLEGKLEKWLNDRYYEEEAEAIAALDKSDPLLAKKLCEVFGVEYAENEEIDPEEIAWRSERLAKLKQLTDDEDVLHNLDCVAFDQEELAELYDRGVEKIYLCEGEFRIPKSKQGLEYVVVGSAIANGLPSKEKVTDESEMFVPPSLFPSEILTKLKNLTEGDGALIYARSDLGSSMSDMHYCDDNIHSKYEAERKAMSIFNSIYSHAQGYFSTYSSQSLSSVATKQLYSLVKNLLIETTDALNSLNEDTQKRNACLLQELNDMINLKTVQRNIAAIAEDELHDRYYQLPDISSYTYQIEYSSSEHDPPGLFGKQDWWFDGMNAWMELNKDLTEKTDAYWKYVSNSFRREVVRPIVDMLERIK